MCIQTNIAILAFISCVLTASLGSALIDKAITKYFPKKKKGKK